MYELSVWWFSPMLFFLLTSQSQLWYRTEQHNMQSTGLSEEVLRSSLRILSEDVLNDVISLLEDPRVCAKHPTGWYLILFIINFSLMKITSDTVRASLEASCHYLTEDWANNLIDGQYFHNSFTRPFGHFAFIETVTGKQRKVSNPSHCSICSPVNLRIPLLQQTLLLAWIHYPRSNNVWFKLSSNLARLDISTSVISCTPNWILWKSYHAL